MNPEAAVGEMFAAFAARDLERARRVLHPDCTWWAEGTATAAGRGEPYSGLEGLQTYFDDAARLWEHLEVHPHQVRTAGSGVICFGVAVGRLKGEASAQRIPVIWVFRMRDGLIVFARAARTAAEARELAERTA